MRGDLSNRSIVTLAEKDRRTARVGDCSTEWAVEHHFRGDSRRRGSHSRSPITPGIASAPFQRAERFRDGVVCMPGVMRQQISLLNLHQAIYMKFSFVVGETEKNTVDFSWNQMNGVLEIKVNGEIVHQGGVKLFSPTNLTGNLDIPEAEKWNVHWCKIQLVEKWDFEVGVTEKHLVRIEKERAKWLAGFRPQKYRIFIDNYLIKEYKGF